MTSSAFGKVGWSASKPCCAWTRSVEITYDIPEAKTFEEKRNSIFRDARAAIHHERRAKRSYANRVRRFGEGAREAAGPPVDQRVLSSVVSVGFGSKWFPKREHLDRLISQCDYQFRLYLLELRPQLVRSGVRQCGEGAAPRRKMSGGKPQLVVSCMHAFQGIESAGGVLLGSAGGLWPPTDGFICVLSKSGRQFHPILHLRGSICSQESSEALVTLIPISIPRCHRSATASNKAASVNSPASRYKARADSSFAPTSERPSL